MSSVVASMILELLAQAGEGASVTPETVARQLDADAWRRRLTEVRGAAVDLARQGRIDILRHGRAVDPEAFKGVYRLALTPRSSG